MDTRRNSSGFPRRSMGPGDCCCFLLLPAWSAPAGGKHDNHLTSVEEVKPHHSVELQTHILLQHYLQALRLLSRGLGRYYQSLLVNSNRRSSRADNWYPMGSIIDMFSKEDVKRSCIPIMATSDVFMGGPWRDYLCGTTRRLHRHQGVFFDRINAIVPSHACPSPSLQDRGMLKLKLDRIFSIASI